MYHSSYRTYNLIYSDRLHLLEEKEICRHTSQGKRKATKRRKSRNDESHEPFFPKHAPTSLPWSLLFGKRDSHSWSYGTHVVDHLWEVNEEINESGSFVPDPKTWCPLLSQMLVMRTIIMNVIFFQNIFLNFILGEVRPNV